MRDLPRITVRGHSVQGGSVPLRKALLPSSVNPWSTRRPCGPLAFRRATEGSRVRGKMWGCQEGDKKPGGCLGPLLSPPGDPGIPPPPGGGTPHAMSWRITPCPGGPLSPAAACRRNGGTAHPLLRVKSKGRSSPPAARRCIGGKAPPLPRGKSFFIFPLDRFVLLYYYHSTT